MTAGGPAAAPRHERSTGARARTRRVARQLVTEWSADRVPDTAAAVAFWAVLSLLPACLALAALLGSLDEVIGGDLAQEVERDVLDFLGRILTSDASGTLDAARELFEERRPGLLTFSVAAAVWTVSRAFAGLVRALDVVYDLDDHRGWFRVRITALVIALGTVLASAVLLVVLVVGPLLGTGEDIAARIGLGDQFAFAWDVLRLPAAFTVLVLWAATVFHVAPDHRTRWRRDLPGAVLTTVLWVVFSGGLRLYLELAQAGNAVFGALGGALIVLLWFWLLSLAVILGGELNQILLEELAPVHGPDAPVESKPAEQGTDAPPGRRSGGVEGVAQAGHEGAGVDR